MSNTGIYSQDGGYRVTLTNGAGAVISQTTPLVTRLAVSNNPTYFTFFEAYAGYATPTDMFLLKGSATKVVRVHQFQMAIRSTAGVLSTVDFVKRTAPNTGGTASQPTISKSDTRNSAATAVVDLYSVIPASLGASTKVGNQITTTTVLTAVPALFSFSIPYASSGITIGEPLTLNGVAESLAFNWGGATLPAGFVGNGFVAWSEADY